MYTNTNFKTKKALKEAVARGDRVEIHAPGLGTPKRDGKETLSGPHFPAAHSWWAEVEMKDGFIVSVK